MQYKNVLWVTVKGFFLAVIISLFFFFILFGFERVFKIFDEDIKKESLAEEHLFRMAGDLGDRIIREKMMDNQEQLQKYLVQTYPRSGNTEVDYIDGTLTVISSSLHERKGFSVNDPSKFKSAESRAVKDSYQVGVKSKFDGDKILLGVSIPLIYKRAIYGVILIREKIPSDRKKILYIFKKVFYLLIVIFVLAFLYIIVTSYQKAYKIKILSSFAKQVVNGELEKRILLDGADDFSSLADSFNQIIENLELQVKESEESNERLSQLNKNLEEANTEKQNLYDKVNSMNQDLSIKVEDATGELRETVQELRNLKIFNDYIFHSISVGILVLKEDNIIEFCNREAKRFIELFYQGDLMGHSFLEVFQPVDKASDLLHKMLETRTQIKEEEISVQEKDNHYYFDISMDYLRGDQGETLGIVVLMIDITEKKSLEEQFLRNKRLASLGQLAAGVAHEIRNPLGAIRGFAELSRKKELAPEKRAYYLDTIISEVQHLNELVSNVLDFAKPVLPNFKKVDLEELLVSVVQVCEEIFSRESASLEIDVPKDFPMIDADSSQLRQVLVNLLKNAAESLTNSLKKKVSVKVISANNGIKILIQDTGNGITTNNLDNIFNPFFSTKDDGTGLGLAIVNKIIENHRGRIDVESEIGNGTLFTIFLPYRQI